MGWGRKRRLRGALPTRRPIDDTVTHIPGLHSCRGLADVFARAQDQSLRTRHSPLARRCHVGIPIGQPLRSLEWPQLEPICRPRPLQHHRTYACLILADGVLRLGSASGGEREAEAVRGAKARPPDSGAPHGRLTAASCIASIVRRPPPRQHSPLHFDTKCNRF
ncbi:unnamed protein product, partial [Iphiclides podalirius]